ncbi:MAG: FtsK/SpoIIIE domain-containing protein [Verrucomicrobiota bacterium]
MNNLPGANDTLALVGELRRVIGEVAGMGSQLEEELRVQLSRERRHLESKITETDARCAASVGEAEFKAQTVREKIRNDYPKRQVRIRKATKTSLERHLHEIDDQEGRKKYDIQRKLLKTDRNRDAERVDAKKASDAFQAALAETYAASGVLRELTHLCFRGYKSLLELVTDIPAPTAVPTAATANELLEQLRETIARTTRDLQAFREKPLPSLFRALPLPWLIIFIAVGVALAFLGVRYLWPAAASYPAAGGLLGALIVLASVLYLVGQRRARPVAQSVAAALGQARDLYDACLKQSQEEYERGIETIENNCSTTTADLKRQWSIAVEEAARSRENARKDTEEKAARIARRHEQHYPKQLERVDRKLTAAVSLLKSQAEEHKRQLTEAARVRDAQLRAEHEARWRALEREWKQRVHPLYESIRNTVAQADALFPAWQPGFQESWTVPVEFSHAAKFGAFEVDLEKLTGSELQNGRLKLPGPSRLACPLLLRIPSQGSVLFESAPGCRKEVIGALNNMILRLLASAPPGRVHFTLIDPVGLGQSFAGVTHLADYGEHIISSRIWTQAEQIERHLAEINEHIEKVIQMYLRNEYATITEYNVKAGSIAEKYHFLVVADFPANFSETAAKRLLSIAASGARCGVFTLIHWDRRQQAPPGVEDLKKSSVCVNCQPEGFRLGDGEIEGTRVTLEAPPDSVSMTSFIRKVGEQTLLSSRVEVPFSHIAPEEGKYWSLDTTSELRVPIGRTGATKLQYLAIGQGTRQHALIAGKTGSGKSTLFHVMITNLALWCSPEHVEFYLVDFKKGVEFQCYAAARLPHARVIAIESDREFGLSVLQRVDEELRRRGELFRRLGVQDLAGYKRAGGTQTIPRSLLIIDEFQEFFTEDDRIAQNAALLLDRIVRQGRAFGIHVLLGSQTLGGAYTLARTTLGQMVIRIALQCNEADAYLIMDENNAAPRLLSRPGEGIYNDAAGAIEGNSPFQTVWLPDDAREQYLLRAAEMARQRGTTVPAPVVFDGNSPADIHENRALQAQLETKPESAPASARIWLGAPNSIKGPTEAVFHRQSGSNLLIVGQRDEAALAILSVGLVSLAAQYPKGTAQFIVFDSSAPGSPERDYLERLRAALPGELTVARGTEIEDALTRTAADMKERSDAAESNRPETFIFILGLPRFKKLRHEEDFSFSSDAAASPGQQLNDLICSGPSVGIHIIAVCDTYNNVNRFLSRKALSEFELRILFQMSANDSASLIDSPKAGGLGLHRAILYNEHEGYLEVFRPYALPGTEWIETASQSLARRP